MVLQLSEYGQQMNGFTLAGDFLFTWSNSTYLSNPNGKLQE